MAAGRRGVAFTPTALTDRHLLAMRLGGEDTTGAAGGTTRAELLPLATAAVEKPWELEPHRALGRYLLEHKGGRQAAFELAVAAGLSRRNDDLAWLAQGYEAMGASGEARAAYEQALSQGLPPELYERVKARFVALGGAQAPFTGDQLIPRAGLADDDRLEDPHLPYGRRQRADRLVVEAGPGLLRIGGDRVDGDFEQTGGLPRLRGSWDQCGQAAAQSTSFGHHSPPLRNSRHRRLP
jgi:hypothetical protein